MLGTCRVREQLVDARKFAALAKLRFAQDKVHDSALAERCRYVIMSWSQCEDRKPVTFSKYENPRDQNFPKQRNHILRQIHQFAFSQHARTFLLIKKYGIITAYTSEKNLAWSLLDRDLVSSIVV